MESEFAALTGESRAISAYRVGTVALLTATALLTSSCHRQQTSRDDGRDPAIAALFSDTIPSTRYSAEGRTYNLQNPAERKALQATLARERGLWDAAKPRDYRFLTRSECFCPGPTRWLMLEVRHDQAVRVWDASGRRVETTAGSLNIDALFDNFARVRDPLTQVQVAFDEQWHYPRFLRTSMAYPDAWSIVVVRGLHPL